MTRSMTEPRPPIFHAEWLDDAGEDEMPDTASELVKRLTKYDETIDFMPTPAIQREAADTLSRHEAALRAIRDCATPEVEDAGFQRRARYDLQEIARAALEENKR